jgi:hypothetical protein
MSGVTILDRITANWVRLTRFIGIYPGTPYDDQEGQLRYYREGNVDGTLYVARHLIGGTYEWMVVSNYTDEMARDAIGTALVAGNNIDITVSDVGNTITVDVESLTSADVTDFNEAVDDRVSALVVAGNNIDVTYNDGSGTLTIDVESLTSTDISDFAETVRDTMGTALVAGNNIDITVVDGSDTITIDVESLTSADITDFATAVDERARDAVGTALVAGNNIDITVVDGSDTITIDVETLTLADISDVTASATEVNYTTDVTSNIQAQIDGKVSDAGDTITGDVTITGGTVNLTVQSNVADALLIETTGGTDIFAVSGFSGEVAIRNGFTTTLSGDLNHDGTNVGFFGTAPTTQRPANADTSGAALGALETEVNQIKQLLRDYGLLAT